MWVVIFIRLDIADLFHFLHGIKRSRKAKKDNVNKLILSTKKVDADLELFLGPGIQGNALAKERKQL